jgi:hypothetical protein
MVMRMQELDTEKHTVLYNVLKKALNSSYSVLPIIAVASSDIGIETDSCMLLRIKDRELFFINPQFVFCGSTITIMADNIVYSLEGTERDQGFLYFYRNKYLDRFPKVYV